MYLYSYSFITVNKTNIGIYYEEYLLLTIEDLSCEEDMRRLGEVL